MTLGFNLLLENLIKPTEKLTDTARCIPVHLALRHPKRMDDMGFSRSTYKDDMLAVPPYSRTVIVRVSFLSTFNECFKKIKSITTNYKWFGRSANV